MRKRDLLTRLKAIKALEVGGAAGFKGEGGDGATAGTAGPGAFVLGFLWGGGGAAARSLTRIMSLESLESSKRVIEGWWFSSYACLSWDVRHVSCYPSTGGLGGCFSLSLTFGVAGATGESFVTAWLKRQLGDRAAAAAAGPVSLMHGHR